MSGLNLNNDKIKTKIILCMFFVCISSVTLYADYHVVMSRHIDSYTQDGQKHAERDFNIEFWFSENALAYILPDYSYIVNSKDKKFIVVNKVRKYYVELNSPVDITKAISGRTFLNYQTYKVRGNVKETGRVKRILNIECKEYEVNWEFDNVSGVSTKYKSLIWASDKMPFKWKLMQEMAVNFRILNNRDEKLMEELQKIQGFQIESDTNMMQNNIPIPVKEKTLIIEEKEAPAGIYTVPEGFRKRSTLEERDISNL